VFVSIDPGIDTGWALWSRLGLVACGLGDPRTCPLHVAWHENDAVDQVDDVWIESQVIYPRSKARPADILKLAHTAGRWAGIYATLGVDAHFVEPAEWKGQTPKAISHARVWAELSTREQAIVHTACTGMAPSKRHNVLDAIGIGQWVRATGRAGR
jgi:hypothetical protein